MTADRDALLDLLGAIAQSEQHGTSAPADVQAAIKRARRHLDQQSNVEAGQRLLDAAEVRRQLDAGFAPRHLRVAREAVAPDHDGDLWRVEAVARAIADAERRGEAGAVVYVHADRCTVEPTYLAEDAELRSLLEPGEVALALRPFPNGPGAVVLYGTPEQIADLCSGGIVPFLADLVEDPT